MNKRISMGILLLLMLLVILAIGGSEAYAEPDDSDGDGVDDDVDMCADTVIPESVPTKKLKPNRWALTDDDDPFVFDTVKRGKGRGRGRDPGRSYTTADTVGCSCEQIIAAQELGKGHTKHGCSIGAMDDWVALMTP